VKKIILYVLDCLRPDHLSCYGYERKTSPEIDKLASEGVVFENAFSNSTWTRSSAASILTSTYPSVHGVMTNNDFLTKELVTLPELLQKCGFVTVVINAMGNLASVYGFDRGFTEYFDLFRSSNLKKIRDAARGKNFGEHESAKDAVNPLSEDINEIASSMLKKYKNDNLFIFCWSIDTHTPLSSPENFAIFSDPNYSGKVDGTHSHPPENIKDEQQWIGLYDSEIYHNDHSIGQLVAELKKLDLYDDTTIMVTSDHGQGLGEHGKFLHGGPPYDYVIRVPMIVKLSRQFSKHADKVSNFIQLIDIFPTITDLAGLDIQKIPTIQGKSFLPLIAGRRDEYVGHDAIYAETHQFQDSPHYRSARTKEWKFIQCDYPFNNKIPLKAPRALARFLLKRLKWLRNSSKMLYNLKDDPLELINLKKIHPEILKKMECQLIFWRKDCEKRVQKSNNQITQNVEVNEDEELKSRLKALGYID